MDNDRRVRVLVVDDTAIYRKILREVLGGMTGIEVVGTAPNGRIALEKIALLKPDVLTLDLEMPEMDGLQTLAGLERVPVRVFPVMVSAHTTRGAEVTLKALQGGAFDFIAKPADADPAANARQLRCQLERVFAALRHRLPAGAAATVVASPAPSAAPVTRSVRPAGPLQVVAIGISTGGPRALAELIPALPAGLAAPVLIVQHMPPIFTAALADSLNQKAALTVCEAGDGQPVRPGTVYVAPGGRHMKVVRRSGEATPRIAITDEPPENHCRPSVDTLFRSVARVYGGRALAVVMTGMGNDGALGLRLMKREGAVAVAQDEASSTVFGMPNEAIRTGVVDAVVPLGAMAATIVRMVKG